MSTQQMTARTMSMTLDPMRANPVIAAVTSIRDLQSSLSPSGGSVRDAGRRQVDALVATGFYSVAPR